MHLQSLLAVAFTLLAEGKYLSAQESMDQLEQRHSAATEAFEAETRTELTRIARDKSLGGEEKIILTEKWFALHSARIAEINAMADVLDEGKPRFRSAPAVFPSTNTAEGAAAAELHSLNRLMAEGKITPEEYHGRRLHALAVLPVVREPVESVRLRTTAPDMTLQGFESTTPDQLAAALHTENRRLAGLPAEESAALRVRADSQVNLLLALIHASLNRPESK